MTYTVVSDYGVADDGDGVGRRRHYGDGYRDRLGRVLSDGRRIVFSNEAFPGDYNCNTSGGTTLATVSAGSLNTTNWTQPFTITGANAGTGTCTFYLYDTRGRYGHT